MSKILFVALVLLLVPSAFTQIDQCPGARPVTPGVPHRNAAMLAPGVQLGNASFNYLQTDITTAGRVLGLEMTRVYRSDMSFDGPIGYGWTGEYFQAAVVLEDGDIRWWDERGFVHTFAQRGSSYIAPPGVYVRAEQVIGVEGASVRLTEANGFVREFKPDGRLTELRDRNGNAVTLAYEEECKLISVTDDRDFSWEFEYDANGRITKLIDRVWETTSRAAREIEYDYDAQGLLVKVRMPETARYSDALNNRIEWHYGYDASGQLTAVTAPNEASIGGAPRIEVEYDEKDRVVRFRDGSLDDHYVRYPESGLVRHLDPRGIRTDYTLDRKGHAVPVERFTGFWDVDVTPPLDHVFVVQTAPSLRASDPASFTTQHAFNKGHERVGTTHPDGREELFAYPNPTKLARGSIDTVAANVITYVGAGWDPEEFAGAIVRLGSGLAQHEYYEVESNTDETLTVKSVDLVALGWGSGDRFVVFSENPDPLAGENLLEYRRVSPTPGVADIVKSWTYETVFQLPRTTTSARGHVTEYEYAYDLDGDPTTSEAGNLILERSPPVELLQPDGTTVTVTYETAFDHNAFGQLTATTDPDGNAELRQYYTSGDQIGFLEQIVAAWCDLDLTQRFEYDKTGLLTGQWPPIAFSAGANADDYKTIFEINELAQTRHESGVILDGTLDERVETYRYFDASGNQTQSWREYVASDGTAPPPPTNPNDPATFNKSSVEMDATWVETLRTFDLGRRVLTETVDAVAGTPVGTDTSTCEYDAQGNTTAKVSPLSIRTEFNYDERYLLWQRVEAEGSTVEGTYEYDYTPNGLIENSRTPLGRETTHTYDGFDREVSVIDPAGHLREFEHDDDDNVTVERSVSNLGQVFAETTHDYDAHGRKFRTGRLAVGSGGSLIGGGVGETWWTLNAEGQAIAETRTLGGSWSYDYDNADRLTGETDPLGNITQLTLDESGQVIHAEFTDFNQLTASNETSEWEADYDRRGNVVRVRDTRHQAGSFDTEVMHTYDGWSRLVASVDPRGAARVFTYDLKSRRTGDFESPDGILLCTGATSGWDKDDRLISTGRWSLPGGTEVQLTGFGHDERNRLTSITRPDGETETLTYDADSNLAGWAGHDDASFTQTTDPRGLVDIRTITRGAAEAGATEESYAWDGARRLVSAVVSEGTVTTSEMTFGYNTLGQADVSSTSVSAPDGTVVGTWVVSAGYDEDARMTSYTYPDGSTVTTELDSLGRFTLMVDMTENLALAEMLWAGPSQHVNAVYFNGTSTTATYESPRTNLVSRLAHEREGEVMQGFDCRYDVNRQLTRQRRDHDGATGRVQTYDVERRLIGVQLGAELSGSALDAPLDPTDFGIVESYALDTVGNRSGPFGLATATDTGISVEQQTYAVSTDGLNRYLSANALELDYDTSARVTYDESSGVYYQYDYRGRLTAIGDAPGFSAPERVFRYDALGRSVLEEEYMAGLLLNRTALQYAPGAEQVTLAEYAYSALGGPAGETLYAVGPAFDGNSEPVAERQDGDWYIRHLDTEGSLIALTDADGKRVVEFDYQPIGAPVRRGISADIAHSEVLQVEEDTPAVGITRVHVSSILTAGALTGCELAISLPGAPDGRYRTAEVLANTATAIDVHDPEGDVLDALVNLGSGFVVYTARSHFDGSAPEWNYDPNDNTSTFTVTGAGFSTWLLGGWLIPNTARPAFLEVIEVDSLGNWLQVRGDATSTSVATDHWRALPPIGVSEYGGWADVESRFLHRGYRHDAALRFTTWPISGWLNRRGLYDDHSRVFDSRLGRWLVPQGTGVRQPYSYRPWGELGDLSVPTDAQRFPGTSR